MRTTHEQLGNLLDCLITMPPGFLPDERHDLVADAAGLRRDIRVARARLERGGTVTDPDDSPNTADAKASAALQAKIEGLSEMLADVAAMRARWLDKQPIMEFSPDDLAEFRKMLGRLDDLIHNIQADIDALRDD